MRRLMAEILILIIISSSMSGCQSGTNNLFNDELRAEFAIVSHSGDLFKDSNYTFEIEITNDGIFGFELDKYRVNVSNSEAEENYSYTFQTQFFELTFRGVGIWQIAISILGDDDQIVAKIKPKEFLVLPNDLESNAIFDCPNSGQGTGGTLDFVYLNSAFSTSFELMFSINSSIAIDSFSDILVNVESNDGVELYSEELNQGRTIVTWTDDDLRELGLVDSSSQASLISVMFSGVEQWENFEDCDVSFDTNYQG